MIYSIQIFAIILLLAISADAFRMVSKVQNTMALKMALADYKEELAKTAAAIAAPGNFVKYSFFFLSFSFLHEYQFLYEITSLRQGYFGCR